MQRVLIACAQRPLFAAPRIEHKQLQILVAAVVAPIKQPLVARRGRCGYP